MRRRASTLTRPGERPRTVLTASNNAGSLVYGGLNNRPPKNDPETDDFPFPYLVARYPRFYQLALFLILVGSLIAVRFAGGPLP